MGLRTQQVRPTRTGPHHDGQGEAADANPVFQAQHIKISHIATVSPHNLAVDSEHRVFRWWYNGEIQCGTKQSSASPTLILRFKGLRVVDIKCGSNHYLVETDNATRCYFLFGHNMHNEVSLHDKAEEIYGPSTTKRVTNLYYYFVSLFHIDKISKF